MQGARRRRSDRLLKVLDAYREVLIVAHNNPDPDAIAAGWALLVLTRKRLQRPARLVARGPILRAENLQFLNLLEPPIELLASVAPGKEVATVLVDCASGSANHVLAGLGPPVAVIDHHESGSGRAGVRFRDIRPTVTASASITASYLREQGLEPSSRLATALLYAIRTEMAGAREALSRVDHTALRWLSGFAQHDILSDIENAPLARHYYEELLLALDSVVLNADVAFCFLPRISGPELVGEVADLLIRCDGLSRVLCAGKLGGDALFSARSKGDDHSALPLLQHVLNGLGHCGGHRHRAGGQIHLSTARLGADALEREVRKRWLEACGSGLRRDERLVKRGKIVERS